MKYVKTHLCTINASVKLLISKFNKLPGTASPNNSSRVIIFNKLPINI